MTRQEIAFLTILIIIIIIIIIIIAFKSGNLVDLQNLLIDVNREIQELEQEKTH